MPSRKGEMVTLTPSSRKYKKISQNITEIRQMKFRILTEAEIPFKLNHIFVTLHIVES